MENVEAAATAVIVVVTVCCIVVVVVAVVGKDVITGVGLDLAATTRNQIISVSFYRFRIY